MSDLRERFERLASEWDAHREARRESSNPYSYLEHASFDAIVALGEPAIPLVIERYRDGSVFWGAALRRMTGRSEFGDGVVGDLESTRRQWLAWWDAQQQATTA